MIYSPREDTIEALLPGHFQCDLAHQDQSSSPPVRCSYDAKHPAQNLDRSSINVMQRALLLHVARVRKSRLEELHGEEMDLRRHLPQPMLLTLPGGNGLRDISLR